MINKTIKSLAAGLFAAVVVLSSAVACKKDQKVDTVFKIQKFTLNEEKSVAVASSSGQVIEIRLGVQALYYAEGTMELFQKLAQTTDMEAGAMIAQDINKLKIKNDNFQNFNLVKAGDKDNTVEIILKEENQKDIVITFNKDKALKDNAGGHEKLDNLKNKQIIIKHNGEVKYDSNNHK